MGRRSSPVGLKWIRIGFVVIYSVISLLILCHWPMISRKVSVLIGFSSLPSLELRIHSCESGPPKIRTANLSSFSSCSASEFVMFQIESGFSPSTARIAPRISKGGNATYGFDSGGEICSRNLSLFKAGIDLIIASMPNVWA